MYYVGKTVTGGKLYSLTKGWGWNPKYHEGYRAGKAGTPKKNPYRSMSMDFIAWNTGYEDAKSGRPEDHTPSATSQEAQHFFNELG
jgi:hypothetical protein